MEIKSIKIDLIDPNPHEPRKEYDQKKLAELAESLKEEQLEPIIVRKNKTRYILMAGQRRILAMKMNGRKTIEAIVHSEITTPKAAIASIVSNFQREEMSIEDTFNAIAKLFSLKLNEATIAQKLGKQVAFVRKVKAIVNCSFPAMDAIKMGRLNVEVALAIAGMDIAEEDREVLFKKSISMGWNMISLRTYLKNRSFDLKTAPWDLQEPTGQCQACAGCQHRSDRQEDLFGDSMPEDARCINSECWEEKRRFFVESMREDCKPYEMKSEILDDNISDYVEGTDSCSFAFRSAKAETYGDLARSLGLNPVIIVKDDYSKAMCYSLTQIESEFKKKYPVKKTTVREHERTVGADQERDWLHALFELLPAIGERLGCGGSVREIVEFMEQ